MSTGREGVDPLGAGGQTPRVEDEAAAGSAAGQEGDILQNQVDEEKARADRYLTNWQRAEADLANFRKRAEQERADLAKYATGSLVGRLLPILDDFDRAIDAIPEDARSLGWVEGIKLIERKLRTVLEQEGVTPIEALGKEFDPHVHEAVMSENGDGDVEMVVAELQKGYKLHDRVLRPAMVKVGRRRRGSDHSEKE